MNSKERIIAAINHRKVDRVPVDFWWSHEIRDRMISHLKLKDQDELQEFIGSDIRCIYPAYIGPERRKYEDGSYEDFWGVIRKPYKHGSGEYDEVIFCPLAEAKNPEDVDNIEWPNPDWFDYEGLIEQCERYKHYGIMVGRMGIESQTIFIQAWFMRGLDRLLLDLAVNPELVKAMLDKIMKFRVEHVRRMLEVVRGKVEMLQIADDYGTQNGLMMSPPMWRDFFAPHLKTLADMAHSEGIRVFLHCCGSSREIIPDLIELGIDILNPIQPQAKGMNPRDLKAHFGSRLCFHGGVDTQKTLPYGTVNEVKAEVIDRLTLFGREGGYILAPVHTVEPDVPLENVLALYETVKNFN